MTEQEWKIKQRSEWKHLRGYLSCKKLEWEHRSTISMLSKRAVKSNGLGVGFIGKKSRVVSEVSLERIYPNRPLSFR